MPWATALAIAAPSVISGITGADAASSAADAQKYAADQSTQVQNKALDFQKSIYGDTTRNLSPYLNQGQTSLSNLNYLLGYAPGGSTPSDGTLANNLGLANGALNYYKPDFTLSDFQQSPAYQFNLDQGRQAIDKAASARGRYYAPATLQDVAKYSQGLASNEFQNAYNNYNTNRNSWYNYSNNLYSRLANQVGSGQNAAVQQGGFGAGIGQQAGANAAAVGNNLVSAGNAQASGIVGQANAIGGAANSAYNNYVMQQILARNQTGMYGGGGYDPNFTDDAAASLGREGP